MPINRRRGGAHGWPCRVGCPVGANLHFHDILLHGALIRKIPVGLYVPLLESNQCCFLPQLEFWRGKAPLTGEISPENCRWIQNLGAFCTRIEFWRGTTDSLCTISGGESRAEDRRVG